MRLDGYRKADEDTDEHLERRPGRIKAVKEKELTSAEIVRRLEQLEKAAGSLSPHQNVDYSVPPTIRQYYGPRWANGGQTGPFVGRRMWTGQAGRFNRLCYECQSPEHFARECPVRLQQGPAPTENPEPPSVVNHIHCVARSPSNQPESVPDLRSPKKVKRCFYCDGEDHLLRLCPLLARPSPEYDLSTGKAEPVQAEQEEAKRQTKQRKRYVTIQVGSQDVSAWVNTTSPRSVVPTTMVELEDILEADEDLLARSDPQMLVVGTTLLRCKIDQEVYDILCLVADNVDEVSLGMDWLNHQRLVWDFGKGYLFINGHPLEIHHDKRPAAANRLVRGARPIEPSCGRLYSEKDSYPREANSDRRSNTEWRNPAVSGLSDPQLWKSPLRTDGTT